jgi:hypothetical protein
MPQHVKAADSTPDTTCTVSDGTCTKSNAFVQRDLTYQPRTGKFTGTLTSNHCPGWETPMNVAAKCTAQRIPDSAFNAAGPKQAPLLGRVALSLRSGVEIYGPFDAGFRDGQVCSGTDGRPDCAGGTDLTVCENHMQYQCATEKGMILNRDMLMDRCVSSIRGEKYAKKIVEKKK